MDEDMRTTPWFIKMVFVPGLIFLWPIAILYIHNESVIGQPENYHHIDRIHIYSWILIPIALIVIGILILLNRPETVYSWIDNPSSIIYHAFNI